MTEDFPPQLPTQLGKEATTVFTMVDTMGLYSKASEFPDDVTPHRVVIVGGALILDGQQAGRVEHLLVLDLPAVAGLSALTAQATAQLLHLGDGQPERTDGP